MCEKSGIKREKVVLLAALSSAADQNLLFVFVFVELRENRYLLLFATSWSWKIPFSSSRPTPPRKSRKYFCFCCSHSSRPTIIFLSPLATNPNVQRQEYENPGKSSRSSFVSNVFLQSVVTWSYVDLSTVILGAVYSKLWFLTYLQRQIVEKFLDKSYFCVCCFHRGFSKNMILLLLCDYFFFQGWFREKDTSTV